MCVAGVCVGEPCRPCRRRTAGKEKRVWGCEVMPLCVSLVLWVFFFSPRHLRTQSTHDDGYMYHTCTTTHFIPPQCRRAPVSFLHVFTPHWRAGQHRSRAARLSPVSSRAPRAAPCLQMSAGSADEEEMNVREAQAALVACSTPRVQFRGRG